MTTSFVSRLGTSPEEGTKAPCRAASTVPLTLSGEQTVSSVALVAGDRCLVAAQSDAAENGIYDVSAGSWTRSVDFNLANDVVSGVLIPVEDTNVIYQATFAGDYDPDVTEVTFQSVEVTQLLGKTGTNTFQGEYDGRGTYHVKYLDDLIGADMSLMNVCEVVHVTQYDSMDTYDPRQWRLIASGATAPDVATGINSDGYFYSSASAAAAWKFQDVTVTLQGKLGTDGDQDVYDAAGIYHIRYLSDLVGAAVTLSVGEVVAVTCYESGDANQIVYWEYVGSGQTAPQAVAGINNDGHFYTSGTAAAAHEFAPVVGSESSTGSFDDNPDGMIRGWVIDSGSTGTFDIDTTTPAEGDGALVTTVDDAEYVDATQDGYTAVSEYRRYLFTMLTKTTGASTLIRLRVKWYTAAKASISTTVAYENTGAIASWTRVGGQLTPPATARFCKVSVYVLGTTDAGRQAWFDDVRGPILIAIEEFYEADESPASGSRVPYYDPTDGKMKSVSAGGFNLPAGVTVAYGGSSAPTGWLLCDGAAVSRATYSVLFAIIGTTFGIGDGASTFNVPNMVGYAVVGADPTGIVLTVDTPAIGSTFGTETHTLDISEIPAHTHTYDKVTYPAGNDEIDDGSPSEFDLTTTSTATGSAGGGGAHNNVQPSLAMNWIIKT